MTPKELTQLLRNAQSTYGDPDVKIDVVKNRLKTLIDVVEKKGEKIFAYDDLVNVVVNLMLKIHELNKEEEKEDNVMEFPTVIQGGKEPPSQGGDNWLTKKPVGSCFLVKKLNDPFNFTLGLFRIGAKTEKAVVLNGKDVPNGNLYVDPVTFCNQFREFEDLGILMDKDTPLEEGEYNDGDRNPHDGSSPSSKVE